jgi:hypothetical protein
MILGCEIVASKLFREYFQLEQFRWLSRIKNQCQEDPEPRKDTRRGQEARAFDLHRTAVTADTEK